VQEDEDSVSDCLKDVLITVIASRAIPATPLFLAAGLMVGIDGWKIATICALALVAHVSGIASRRVEQLSFIAVVLATVAWLNLLLKDAKSQLAALLH
jgi:hypothetical protein